MVLDSPYDIEREDREIGSTIAAETLFTCVGSNETRRWLREETSVFHKHEFMRLVFLVNYVTCFNVKCMVF